MDMTDQRTTSLRIATAIAVIALLVAVPGARAAGFVEDFATDPRTDDRWIVLDGDGARFVYDDASHTLTAHYDTLLPTARLVRPLATTIDLDTSFRYTVEFEIRDAGHAFATDRNAQIAWGLLNRTTTGTDRPGGQGGSAYDLVSVDYFPNITPFGGPTLGPTIIHSDTGIGFFPSLDFTFGQETRLESPGEGSLPFDTPLTATLDYARDTRDAIVTVSGPSGLLTINTIGESGAVGGPDGDTHTLHTLADGAGFAVDAFGILLWKDTFASKSTVKADVVFRRVVVQIDSPVAADRDGDGDVDLADFSAFLACFNGPGQPPAESGCDATDQDRDGDVDLADFAVFLLCFNGPERPPGCE